MLPLQTTRAAVVPGWYVEPPSAAAPPDFGAAGSPSCRKGALAMAATPA